MVRGLAGVNITNVEVNSITKPEKIFNIGFDG